MSQYKKTGQSYFRSKGYFFAKKRAMEKELTLVIQMIDQDTAMISGPIVILKQEIRALGGIFSTEEKGWVLPIKKIEALKNAASKKNANLKFYEMPKFVNKLLESFPRMIEYKTSDKENIHITYHHNEERKKISDLPQIFQKKLYDFQKEGVAFGIQNCGRVLIADEMGVGKTAQALALASLYRSEWPFIVFVPSSLRFVWREEILTWFEDVTSEEIQVIVKSNQKIQENVKALVISYDLGARMTEQIKSFGKFNMAIADEAYYLKNSDAKRTEQIVPFLQSCKRILLLAGTPALARPKEIFNLLHILRPDIFKDFKEFGKRYCVPAFNKFARGIDYTGASNLKELHYILTNSLMIRRLKKDVLSQLPDKVRQKIQVETNSDYLELINEALKKNKNGGAADSEKMSQILEKLTRPEWGKSGENFEAEANKIEKDQELKFPQFFECYKYTGLAKLDGIKKYLKEVLQQQESKFLVFAHHGEILDALEQEVAATGIKYIRIDGSVQTKKRFELVKSFQEDPEVKVGILSLTAAGIGLTLTEASKIIFAEMYWTPAIMLQAEDRIHRIGQKEKTSVNYYYLYGEDTLDALLYKILQKKIAIVSEMLEGEANQLRLDTENEPEDNSNTQSKKVVKKKMTESEKKRIECLEVYEYNPFEANKRKTSGSEEGSEQSHEFSKKLTDIRDSFYLERLNNMANSQATVKKERVSKGPEKLIKKLTKNKNSKEELIKENSGTYTQDEEFQDLLTQSSQSNPNPRKYKRTLGEEEEEVEEAFRKSKNQNKQERKQAEKSAKWDRNKTKNNLSRQKEGEMQIEETKSNKTFLNRSFKSQAESDSVDWGDVDVILSKENTINIFEENKRNRDTEVTMSQRFSKKNENSDSNDFELELIDQMLSAQRQQPKRQLVEEQDEFSNRLLEICTKDRATQKVEKVDPQVKIITTQKMNQERNTLEKIKNNLDAFNYSKSQNKNNGRGYVRVTQTQPEVIEKPPSPKKENIDQGQGGFLSQISADYYNFKKNIKGGNSQYQQDYSNFRSRTFSNDNSFQSKKSSRENSKVMEEEEDEFEPAVVVRSFEDIIKEKNLGQIKEETQKPTINKITPYIRKNNNIPNEVKGMRNYMRTISDEYDDPLGFNDLTDFKEIKRSPNNLEKEEELLTKRKLPTINENDEEDNFYTLLKKMK